MWLWVRELLGAGGLEVPGEALEGLELQGRVPQTPSPRPAPPTSRDSGAEARSSPQRAQLGAWRCRKEEGSRRAHTPGGLAQAPRWLPALRPPQPLQVASLSPRAASPAPSTRTPPSGRPCPALMRN